MRLLSIAVSPSWFEVKTMPPGVGWTSSASLCSRSEHLSSLEVRVDLDSCFGVALVVFPGPYNFTYSISASSPALTTLNILKALHIPDVLIPATIE